MEVVNQILYAFERYAAPLEFNFARRNEIYIFPGMLYGTKWRLFVKSLVLHLDENCIFVIFGSIHADFAASDTL